MRFDFNSSMATSFDSTFLIKFDCNPSMAISCTSLLSSILFLKTFELKVNLYRKDWNALKLFSSSRDDMLKKVIEQKKIMSCIEVCPNAYGCVANFFKENVYTIGGAICKG
jgi:hypothetical protein